MFRIGQEIVCIDDDYSIFTFAQLYRTPRRPVKGQKYTVRGLHYVIDERQTILLEEIINPVVRWMAPWGLLEPGFWISRFKPVVETKTDISTLIALLNPINHKHLEGV